MKLHILILALIVLTSVVSAQELSSSEPISIEHAKAKLEEELNLKCDRMDKDRTIGRHCGRDIGGSLLFSPYLQTSSRSTGATLTHRHSTWQHERCDR